MVWERLPADLREKRTLKALAKACVGRALLPAVFQDETASHLLEPDPADKSVRPT